MYVPHGIWAVITLVHLENSWSRVELFKQVFRTAELPQRQRCMTFCRLLSEELKAFNVKRKLTPPRLYEYMKRKGEPGYRKIDDSLYKALLSLALKFGSSRKAVIKRIEHDIALLQQFKRVWGQAEFASDPANRKVLQAMCSELHSLELKDALSKFPNSDQLEIAEAFSRRRDLSLALIEVIAEHYLGIRL